MHLIERNDLVSEQFLKPVSESIYLPRKKRRTYRNVLSGTLKTRMLNRKQKFFTLTTSQQCVQRSHTNHKSLYDDYKILMKRLKRLTPQQLVDGGYLNNHQVGYFYGKNVEVADKTLWNDIEYFKVRTSEGNGVLHIVLRSLYLPQQFISDLWNEIHYSPVVDIREINVYDHKPEQIAGYLIAQYMSGGQEDAYVKSSMSKGWIFPGANRCWSDLKKKYLRDTGSFSYYYQWYHPYLKGSEYQAHFEELMQDFKGYIKESVQDASYRYRNDKPPIAYPAPVLAGNDFYHRFAYGQIGMSFPFWKYPVYDFPPIFKKTHQLSDVEEDSLALEVLNDKFKHSSEKNYDKFVEERVGDRAKRKKEQRSLEEFYQVGDYCDYNKGL